MAEDTVRVLRIIEYVGPRSRVEEQLSRSMFGQRTFDGPAGKLTIRVATLGMYPEILEAASEFSPVKGGE